MKILIFCFLILISFTLCIVKKEQALQIFRKLDQRNIPLEMFYRVATVKHREVNFEKMDLTKLERYKKFLEKKKKLYKPKIRAASDSEVIDWALVINTAEKVWTFIEKNKAVENYEKHNANAIPKGVTSPFEMEYWSSPTTRSYNVVYKNLLGITVLDLTYTVSFSYGGSYQGKGKYLDNITIIPTHVSVAWGFTLTAQVTVPSVINQGSTSNPVAGATINLNYKLSALNTQESMESFFVNGNGGFSWINKL